MDKLAAARLKAEADFLDRLWAARVRGYQSRYPVLEPCFLEPPAAVDVVRISGAPREPRQSQPRSYWISPPVVLKVAVERGQGT